MKIALLYGYTNLMDEIHNPLLEDIVSAGIGCEFVHVNEYENVNQFDAAYMLTHSRKLDVSKIKVPFVNSYESQVKAIDKVQTQKILKEKNISHPETLLADNYEQILDFVDQQRILKTKNACAGHGHYILTKENNQLIAQDAHRDYEVIPREDHLEINNHTFCPPYLVQEFISHNGTNINNFVYRVYVVGNKAAMATRRIKESKTPGESIVNIAQGAHYEFVDLDTKLADIALQTADAVGFDIGVVDVLENKNKDYFVIECDCDSKHTLICRKFRKHNSYCNKYNFNRMIGERLVEIANGSNYRK